MLNLRSLLPGPRADAGSSLGARLTARRREAGKRVRHWKGRIAGRCRSRAWYVTDGAGWVIDAEGRRVTELIRKNHGVDCPLWVGPDGLQYLYRQVLHFGTQNFFTAWRGFDLLNWSNRIALTYFHGDPADPAFAEEHATFMRHADRVDRVIVSCRIMARRVEAWGIPADKVVRIPVGVDTGLFRPPAAGERDALRARLGIDPDQVVLGSFQKDGDGWGDGMSPKRVKGPDVFLEVVERLRRDGLPLFVLLTGPARGYVRSGLEALGVPYHHVLLDRYEDVAAYYHALDLYLVASREEGGPKGIVESMASGVPVVSTEVGLAPDLLRDGENGFLCAVEDVDALADRVRRIAADRAAVAPMTRRALDDVQVCRFDRVAELHVRQVYEPLLRDLRGARSSGHG